MTRKLRCHHGHRFQAPPEAEGSLICPCCGAVTKFQSRIKTKPQGSFDRTLDLSSAKGDTSQPGSNDRTIDLPPSIPESDAGDQPEPNASKASKTKPPTEVQADGDEVKPPNLPGYAVVEELGRGGMGVVYRAKHLRQNRDVALKTLLHISPIELQRFKQEFRALADIAHPNLAGLYDLLSDGTSWCFSMELLKAVDFVEYVWSGFDAIERDKTALGMSASNAPRLSAEVETRLIEGLKQLVLGLSALHQAGMLHRDIKPSNVLVTTEGRVVLVDFGLASQFEDGSKDRPTGIQGTPQYMAPEQAACNPISPASDWYAVGVMLYEVLTGLWPIEGKPLQIILKKQTETPKAPLELDDTVPKHLNDLCVALLERDAANRPDGAGVLRAIGADNLIDSIQTSTRLGTGQSIELVGREDHLTRLRSSFRQVTRGLSTTIFVHGKSGMGKSVLIQKFLDEVREEGQALVLTGRCYEQESVPFKALDSLIDSLAECLAGLPEAEIKPLTPEDFLPLVRVFPVLGQIPDATHPARPSIENVDQKELRTRAMRALRELLKRLGDRQPVVLSVDDLQWGDEDSAELVADLLRPPDSPRVLLLGSYRSENRHTSLCLKALDAAYSSGQQHPHREEIAVDSLQEVDAKRLALQLLDRSDDEAEELAAKIAHESGGWPFFVWELAQHVQDDPRIADQALELDEVIWKRVNRLPEEARQFLELVAVVGRPVPATEAYQALDAVEKGQAYLAQLRTTNFVRMTAAEDEDTIVETYHDRVRESIVDHLDEPTIKCHNRSLALTIEKVSGIQADDLHTHLARTPDYEEPQAAFELEQHKWQRVFDLAYFFDAAGEHERALPFALVAAERAQNQNALEVSEQQYGIALRGCAKMAAAMQLRVHEGLGDILMLRGRYDEAEEQFDAARALAKGDTTIARVDGKLGELSFKRGDQKTATEHIERALTALGHKPPISDVGVFACLAKEGMTQVLHSMFPGTFTGRRDLNSDRARTDLLTVHLCGRLSYAYWFSRSLNATVWAHLRQMNLAERYPPTLELGQAYSLHAPIMSAIAYYSRGIDYSERSLKIRQEKQDRWGQGQTLHFHGVVLFAASEFEESIEKCTEAIQFLEGAGDFWESCSARYHMAESLYHLGDLRQAVHEAKIMYQQAVDVGDASASAYVLNPWAAATQGRIPNEIFETEFARPREDPLATVQLIQSRGIQALLGEDDPEQAVDLIQESIEAANKRGLQNTYVMGNYAWLTTSLRILAQRADPGSTRQKDLLRKAKKTVRKAIQVSRKFQNNLAHALRESAMLATLAGREAEARKLFAASLATAECQRMKYQHAKTSLAQAEAGVKFGWPDADGQAAQAKQVIEALEEFEDA